MGKGVKSYMETDIGDSTKDADTIYYATYLIGDEVKGADDKEPTAPDPVMELLKSINGKVDAVVTEVETLKATANDTASSKAFVSKETLQEVNRLTAKALRDLKTS